MQKKIAEILEKRIMDKNGLRVVPFFACREAARECGVSPREAEIAALRSGLCPSRYERNIGTFGLEGQARLLESRVAVAGCGGLGGWVIEILARSGVGAIVMIDGDVFDDNNLNRQLYSHEENIGVSKAVAAARRVTLINGAVEAVPKAEYINETNGADILKGCDLVVDALDSNKARSAVFSVCRALKIPFVHGAIGGYYAQAGVFYPEDTPFWESCGAPDKGVEVETGNPPFIPPFAAAVEVAEAVKILAGLEGRLKGALLWFDLQRDEMQRLNLHKKA